MKYSHLVCRVALALACSAFTVAACGDSESGTPSNAAAGAGGTNNTNDPLQPGSGANGSVSNAGTSNEGNPGSVLLDPSRDPSVPINLLESGAVNCGGGGDFCIAPNLTCCVSAGDDMATFSCAPNADACPDGTTSSAECSSSSSCSGGQVCCSTGGGGGPGGGAETTTCEASCPDGSEQLCLEDAECGEGASCNNGTCGPAACTTTSCGGGELCCRPQGGGGGVVPACVAAGADGLCPDGQRLLCEGDTDCQTGETCDPVFGGGGGGVTVCTPPPCTPGSCGEGQACCVGGGLGGAGVCAPAIETGGCQGNSRLVCVTDAECAPTPGTQCLLGPGGFGALSCRVPPPPAVADAGAPDGG